jgi:hypothetical protein
MDYMLSRLRNTQLVRVESSGGALTPIPGSRYQRRPALRETRLACPYRGSGFLAHTEPASPSCVMRLSSVTIHGKTATGRPGRISITAFLATRALKLLAPDAQLLEMEGATDEPATINLLSVFSQLWRTVSQRREMNHLQQKPILAKGKRL